MKIPISIPECFEFLEVVVDAELLDQIRILKRDELTEYYQNLGQYIRNNWLFGDDSPLIKALRIQGMTHYHEGTLAVLIIELFWEHLQGEVFLLDNFLTRLKTGDE